MTEKVIDEIVVVTPTKFDESRLTPNSRRILQKIRERSQALAEARKLREEQP